jgi:hypothetical protein
MEKQKRSKTYRLVSRPLTNGLPALRDKKQIKVAVTSENPDCYANISVH